MLACMNLLHREEGQAEASLAEANAALMGQQNAEREALSDQLQQADSRFWELEENDLSICLRPDGTDWQLGVGAFGTVRSSPPQPPSVRNPTASPRPLESRHKGGFIQWTLLLACSVSLL